MTTLSHRPPSVVAFGGGHGLHASLSALRRITNQITAVVTVADDGGSSGKLREEFGCLPPGDLRMALSALCGDDWDGRTWADLLQIRFNGDGPLAGHAVGNLLIAALWQELGDPVSGLDLISRLLGARGRVLPMASIPLEIEADVWDLGHEHDDVTPLRGQARVATTRGQVREIRLIPDNPPACAEAVQAVCEADYLILGPGSWFTSVVPHLLVPELCRAIIESPAKRIVTMNLKPADETDGFTASQHIEVLADHAPELRLDWVLADESFAFNDRHLETFVTSLGGELVVADLAVRDGSPRHDHLRLGSAYAELLGLASRS
ncbi:gluconeogenesis factor YvcK family protein [Enemella sp. A6]|uniref:gluconeogenesis factor YvcK family protein n=1 Tax=Enemella sp. A6 TaxID=3440152 RepID=UPI003EBA116A